MGNSLCTVTQVSDVDVYCGFCRKMGVSEHREAEVHCLRNKESLTFLAHLNPGESKKRLIEVLICIYA